MDPHAIVDAHLHLLDPGRIDYPWLAQRPVPGLPSCMEQLDLEFEGARKLSFVVIEGDARGEDTERELLAVEHAAARDPRIVAFVARAPLEQGAAVEPWLERLAQRPLVRGVRRVLQDDADASLCARAGFEQGVRLAAERGLLFEACIRAHQLPALTELARRVPEVRIVLDHLGKPELGRGLGESWRAQLADLARLPNTFAKLSGLASEAGPGGWSRSVLAPFVEHALEVFGPERLLFGSDWPVSRAATGYARWLDTLAGLLEACEPAAICAVLGGNARRLYRLEGASAPS